MIHLIIMIIGWQNNQINNHNRTNQPADQLKGMKMLTVIVEETNDDNKQLIVLKTEGQKCCVSLCQSFYQIIGFCARLVFITDLREIWKYYTMGRLENFRIYFSHKL